MADKPIRLQLSRAKGFNLQQASIAANGLPAVKVDRSTWWGNPFRIGCSVYMRWPDDERLSMGPPIKNDAEAVIWFRAMWEAMEARSAGSFSYHFRKSLRGKNLACWCKPGAPCHADVLLDLANRPICEEVSAHD